MKYSGIVNEIKKKYNNKIITREQIIETFNNIYNNKNEKTLRNIIGILKSNNIITELEKDKYILVTKNIFRFKSSSEISKIYDTIQKEYSKIDFIVWNTEIINEFTLHYIVNNYIIVEVEKIGIELVVNLLKEKYLSKYTIVTQDMLNNNREMYLNTERFIVIKPLLTKAPLINKENKKYITIEKIMVDLYKDKLYLQYQGKELKTIYENIFDKYNINMKKLINYAKLRIDIGEYKKYVNALNIPQIYKVKEE